MDTQTQEIMFSTGKDDHETPNVFFNKLNLEFGFTLDPASNALNAKCSLFYTEKDDGLSKSWEGHTVFVNPPYSQNKKWIKKCFEEGQQDDTIVVVLIPARTDTSYFHQYCMKAAEIRFVKGRLQFKGSKSGAPFPSMVVVFKKHNNKAPIISSMERF